MLGKIQKGGEGKKRVSPWVPGREKKSWKLEKIGA